MSGFCQIKSDENYTHVTTISLFFFQKSLHQGNSTPVKRGKQDNKQAIRRKLISNGDEPVQKSPRICNELMNSVTDILDRQSEQFSYKLMSYQNNSFLEVTKREPDLNTPNGPITLAKVLIHPNGESELCLQGREKEKLLQLSHPIVDSLTANLSMLGSKWGVCGGISLCDFKDATAHLRYTPSGCKTSPVVHKSTHSANCKTWFQRSNRSHKNNDGTHRCTECSKFHRYLTRLNRSNNVTPEQRQQRINPSSKYRIDLLSPRSQRKRVKKMSRKITSSAKRIKKLERRTKKYRMELADEQNKEMCDITGIINSKYEHEVENLIMDASKTSKETSTVLREIWDNDTKDREDFFHDQMNNKTGHKGNTWSTITYRIAMAVYTKSPCAYKSLKSFKILQLPSEHTLGDMSRSNLHEPGINESIHSYMATQRDKYSEYKDEKIKRDVDPVPLNEGILIHDEVKVTAKVRWNSKNKQFCGLEMNPEDYPFLDDLYLELDPRRKPKPAQYMLQFLWRDISSDFDVIGPYFSSANSLEHGFIISCIMETMQLCHAYGFHVIGIVCDGASSNLTAIKMLCTGKRGTFGKKDNAPDKHKVKTYFDNPFNPNLKVYCVICPSHQLKNVINALFQSRIPGGTKLFCLEFDKPYFGWKTIQDVYQREINRFEAGQLRQVPKLKQSFIERDAWTKLNVLPAKIMQQPALLRELETYLNPENGIAPADFESSSQCLKYLQSCNLLFENGMLSHKKVKNLRSPPLANIKKGYDFFL